MPLLVDRIPATRSRVSVREDISLSIQSVTDAVLDRIPDVHVASLI